MAINPPSPIPRSQPRPFCLCFTCARLMAADCRTSCVADGRGAPAPRPTAGAGRPESADGRCRARARPPPALFASCGCGQARVDAGRRCVDGDGVPRGRRRALALCPGRAHRAGRCFSACCMWFASLGLQYGLCGRRARAQGGCAPPDTPVTAERGVVVCVFWSASARTYIPDEYFLSGGRRADTPGRVVSEGSRVAYGVPPSPLASPVLRRSRRSFDFPLTALESD